MEAHKGPGGTGRAYRDTSNNLSHAKWFNPIRVLEHVDLAASETADGGFKVGRTEPGEWIEYTVSVADAGTRTLELRVSSQGAGGTFHVEFDGIDKTGPLSVPDTGGWEAWQTVTRPNVMLHGRHTGDAPRDGQRRARRRGGRL